MKRILFAMLATVATLAVSPAAQAQMRHDLNLAERQCFQTAMSGALNGGGTFFNHDLAHRLCKGTYRGEAPTQCFRSLIPGCTVSYGGGCVWAAQNAVNLCRGTSFGHAPIECFREVMSGRISYGGGNVWRWENAIKLCTGSMNHEVTIECFQRHIGMGEPWEMAIAACAQQKNDGRYPN